MFGVIISEYVPNTFFAHVYDEDMGMLRETFRTHSLPKFIKPIAKLLCARCELQFIANLTRLDYLKILFLSINAFYFEMPKISLQWLIKDW